MRSGKNTAHVEARIVEGDNTLCLMVGVFGAARESSVALRPAQAPVHADKANETPLIRDVVPNFTQHFRARWLEGAPPFSGVRNPRSVVDLAMRDAGEVTEYHVVAMAPTSSKPAAAIRSSKTRRGCAAGRELAPGLFATARIRAAPSPATARWAPRRRSPGGRS